MKLKAISVIVLLLNLVSCAAQKNNRYTLDYKKGKDLYEHGAFSESMTLFLSLSIESSDNKVYKDASFLYTQYTTFLFAMQNLILPKKGFFTRIYKFNAVEETKGRLNAAPVSKKSWALYQDFFFFKIFPLTAVGRLRERSRKLQGRHCPLRAHPEERMIPPEQPFLIHQWRKG